MIIIKKEEKMVDKILESIYGPISDLNEWNDGLKKISFHCMGHSGGGASLIPLDEGMQEWRFGSNDDKNAEFLYYSYWKDKSPLFPCIKKI